MIRYAEVYVELCSTLLSLHTGKEAAVGVHSEDAGGQVTM